MVKKNTSPIDFLSALERVGDDESFLYELLDIYTEDFKERFNSLEKAIENKNFEEIREVGHSLKGSSANLSLLPLQEASSEMEMAGVERDIEKAKKSLILLQKEFEQLNNFLSENKPK